MLWTLMQKILLKWNKKNNIYILIEYIAVYLDCKEDCDSRATSHCLWKLASNFTWEGIYAKGKYFSIIIS